VVDLSAPPVEVGEAARLAAWSAHPLSKVLAQQVTPAVEDAWRDVHEQPGAGLEGRQTDDTVWRLGSRAWVQGVSDEKLSATDQPVAQVWFGPLGQPRWCFEFAEQLRPDALSAVAALRAGGVELGLLSGDASRRVVHIAEQVGIDEVIAGAQPQDKLAHLARAQARGECVGMVGDGVNDAPVLARADVSFAMGQGALVARVHADAVVVSGRLQDVVSARQLAQRAMQVVRQNLIWAATYNLACVPLALAGYLPPWAAGLGMALSSLLVVGNATRLAYVRPGPV
jgi:Cu2+-exporting ATPase